MALLASRLLHRRHLLCLLRRLLVLLPPQPSTSLPVFLLRTARDSRAPSPAAPLRAALRRKKQGSQKDARRRGALWLINTRRLVRGRTVTHVHGVGRSLSLSFPFSVSVPLCRPSPHTAAAFAALTHPSLLSIRPFPRLSTTFPFSSLPPSRPPRRYARLSRLSVFVRPSPARRVPFLLLSLRLSRSRFFSCFFHRPLRFFLSLMPLSTVLLPFVYYHRLLSFNPFLPRPFHLPPFRPSLHTPAASVETARFFPPVSSAPTFFTPFFSPPPPFPTAAHAPPSPAIGISPRASAPSPSLSRRTYAHGLSPSRPVYPPPFSSSHSSTSRFPLTSLSFFPAFHPPPPASVSLFYPSSTPPLQLLFF